MLSIMHPDQNSKVVNRVSMFTSVSSEERTARSCKIVTVNHDADNWDFKLYLNLNVSSSTEICLECFK